ncbi:hypothetical protein BDL97_07G017400 [Sphagnum fallax]|nr:hypothetical protein BDL97_07G017400 [Sphagnum fallax]
MTMVALVCMDQSVGLGSLASRSCRAELQTFRPGEASTSVTVARNLQNGSSRPSFVPRKQQQHQAPSALLSQQRLTVFAEKEALSGVEERTGSRLGFEDRENSDGHSMNFAAVSVDDPTLAAGTASSNATVAVTNLGNNMRKMEATIAIRAPLEAVWGVLTDYEHLADHIPGLAVSQILERRPSGARLLQIGQKNLALGVKFKAKAVVEVSEEAAQELPNGTLRDLHFETVEGDFQVFKGTWRMHQVHSDKSSKSPSAEKNVETHLSYILKVQPKHWIPVALIEGVVCNEVICNLNSVRSVALRHKLLSHHP